jgi:hypothetical protein
VTGWEAYLSAAQDLDRVRTAASSAAAQRSEAATTARTELAGLRARLEPQRARLVRDLHVPVEDLTPTADELAGAAATVAGGPATVLAALREARSTADTADAAVVARAKVKPWQRNIMVYGPFAVVVLVAQIVLYWVADDDARLGYALLCSLTLPVAAFGLGWVGVGIAFGGTGRTVDRTPIVGAVVCLAPVLITCMGVGVLSLLN